MNIVRWVRSPDGRWRWLCGDIEVARVYLDTIVRQAEPGWYAVRTDGRVLGQGNSVTWFPTAPAAFMASDKERLLPKVPDPFRPEVGWRWIKVRKSGRAVQG